MNTRKVEDLKVEDVISVYSGKDGACCCGCSGTHSYNSAYKDLASKRRGYEVKDNEVKDREVKRILNIIKRADPKDLDNGGETYIATVVRKRLYIVYLKERAEEIVKLKEGMK